MHTRVSISQLKDRTPFVFYSVKPVSISLSLTAEDNHSSDFCINHPLLLFLGLLPCIYCWTCLLKLSGCEWNYTVCIFLWLAASAYRFRAWSVLVHLIEIHRIFCCLMYEYTMIYLSIPCLMCFWVVSGSHNRQGCIEYPSLYMSPGYTCAVASLGCVHCWECNWLIGFPLIIVTRCGATVFQSDHMNLHSFHSIWEFLLLTAWVLIWDSILCFFPVFKLWHNLYTVPILMC